MTRSASSAASTLISTDLHDKIRLIRSLDIDLD